MKITALRVAELGRFSEPVAIEDIADGLTVFTGDNEAGKSTLFRALLAAFKSPYTSKDKAIVALQPYDGGAPLIEVDFTSAGRNWRLRKRFLQRPLAELVDLDTGATVASNADVQAQLDGLRSGPSGLERFGLLWVAQGDALEHFKIAPDTFSSLRTIVQQEVEGTTIDEGARRVHASVVSRLAELMTPKTARPTGVHAKAIADLADAQARQQEAASRLAAADARLSQLAAAAAEADGLRNPVARAARQTAIAEAEQALRTAADDRARARAAIDQRQAAESTAEAARLKHKSWHDNLARAAVSQAEAARLQSDLVTARDTLEKAAARDAEIAATAHEIAEASAGLDNAIAAARAAEEQAQLARQRDELADRLAAIRALDAELQTTKATLADLRVDAATLRKLQTLTAALDRIDQRLTAAAPEVEIAPLAAGEHRIRVDGSPLAHHTTIRVRQPLDVAIDNIAHISVRPGGSDDLAASKAERARVDHELSTCLAACGVADLASAEQAAEARHQQERQRDDARTRLSVMAPDGIDQIMAAHAHLVAATARSSAPVLSERPLAALLQAHADLAARQRSTAATLTDARRQLEGARRDLLKLETLLATTTERQAELAQTLGPAEERQATTTALDHDLAVSEQRRAEAVRDASVWREALRSDDQLKALERRLAEAKAADAADSARLRQLELDIRGWEGALAADSESDIEHEAEIAAQIAKRCADQVARMQDDVAALRKLDAMLIAALEAERSGIAAPVARRLGPYLDLVLPGASLRMDEGLSPSGLVRAARTEPLERVSRGTAEQIAVIARLGLAKLLADRGAPAPLILDDALVYADDRRIAALFSALTEAARHHQVIVLTCRERTFDALPGKRVELTSWRNARG